MSKQVMRSDGRTEAYIPINRMCINLQSCVAHTKRTRPSFFHCLLERVPEKREELWTQRKESINEEKELRAELRAERQVKKYIKGMSGNYKNASACVDALDTHEYLGRGPTERINNLIRKITTRQVISFGVGIGSLILGPGLAFLLGTNILSGIAVGISIISFAIVGVFMKLASNYANARNYVCESIEGLKSVPAFKKT